MDGTKDIISNILIFFPRYHRVSLFFRLVCTLDLRFSFPVLSCVLSQVPLERGSLFDCLTDPWSLNTSNDFLSNFTLKLNLPLSKERSTFLCLASWRRGGVRRLLTTVAVFELRRRGYTGTATTLPLIHHSISPMSYDTRTFQVAAESFQHHFLWLWLIKRIKQ